MKFRVDGTPVTQGSMNRGRNNTLYHKNGKALEVWRQRIGVSALASLTPAERRSLPLSAPMSLVAHFTVPKPVSNKDEYPVSLRTGDLDKYLRAVGDALTAGGIIKDDSLIVDMWGRKRYIGTPQASLTLGVDVWLTEVTDDEKETP